MDEKKNLMLTFHSYRTHVDFVELYDLKLNWNRNLFKFQMQFFRINNSCRASTTDSVVKVYHKLHSKSMRITFCFCYKIKENSIQCLCIVKFSLFHLLHWQMHCNILFILCSISCMKDGRKEDGYISKHIFPQTFCEIL